MVIRTNANMRIHTRISYIQANIEFSHVDAIDGGQDALEMFQQLRSRRQAAETSSRETLPQSHSPADACHKRIDR